MYRLSYKQFIYTQASWVIVMMEKIMAKKVKAAQISGGFDLPSRPDFAEAY